MTKIGGFTLIEVMVAITILAIALVSLLSLQNNDLKAVQSAESLITASMLAEKLMEEYSLKIVPKELHGSEGNLKWVLTVSQLSPEIKRVSLLIQWDEGKEKKHLNVVEYVYVK
ncbi:MAG: type II secretion system minor pseudopilin GspI [Nitrospirota bacterium]